MYSVRCGFKVKRRNGKRPKVSVGYLRHFGGYWLKSIFISLNQLIKIVNSINQIGVQTELLEMLDWDENRVDELLIIVSKTVNNSTISLVRDVSRELRLNGYSDIVVEFIDRHIQDIISQKEISYDC